MADVPQLEVRVGRCQRLLGVRARVVEGGPAARRRQDGPLGERVRLTAAKEDQGRLAVLDPLFVGLHQRGPAIGMQRRHMRDGLHRCR